MSKRFFIAEFFYLQGKNNLPGLNCLGAQGTLMDLKYHYWKKDFVQLSLCILGVRKKPAYLS